MSDQELLQQYVRVRSETAFTELVRRHIGWVYSAALRQVHDPHLADDVTQAVFVALARRAGKLTQNAVLSPWLFQVMRYASANAIRAEMRRRHHEQTAAAMTRPSTNLPAEQSDWDSLAPLLEELVARLRGRDRQAVLLRFYERKSFAEVAGALGVSEAAARKRTERAVDKLRTMFARRGVSVASSAVLAGILVAHVSQPAQAAVLAASATAGLAAGQGASAAVAGPILALTKEAVRMMGWTMTMKAVAAVVMVAILLPAAFLASRALFLPATVSVPGPATPAARGPSGVVVDRQGRPVSNAYVCPAGQNPYQGVRTDKQGQFTLANLPAVPTVYLAYSQRSRALGVFRLPAAAAPATPQVVLGFDEATVEGRVVDPRGNAAVAARPELLCQLPDGLSFTVAAYSPVDDNGDYAFGVVPAGAAVRLQVRLSGVGADAATQVVTTTPGQRLVQLPDLVAPRAVGRKPGVPRQHLAGRVLDESGQPIAGAEVEAQWRDPANVYVHGKRTTTDDQGRWSLRVGPDTPGLSLRLSHPDYISFHFADCPMPSLEHLRDATAVSVMKRGVRLNGVVKDPAGQPVTNALVLSGRLYSSTGGPENETIEDGTAARTDAAGCFSIGGLPTRQLELHIDTGDYAPAAIPVQVKPDMAPVAITLDTGIRCKGRVVDAEGQPVADATVSCQQWTTNSGRQQLTRVTTTDGEGRFVLSALPRQGSIQLCAGKKGYLYMTFQGWQGQTPESELDAGTVTLYRPPLLAGTVVDDATGQPVSRFRVTSGWGEPGGQVRWLGGFGEQSQENNPDGRFSITVDRVMLGRESPCIFAARIQADGYATQVTPEVAPGQKPQPLVIRLKRAQPLTGTVLDAHGQALAKATVAWVGPGSVAYIEGTQLNRQVAYPPDPIVQSDAQGRFRLMPSDLAGRVLILHEAGYAILPSPQLKADEPVRLTPWATVEGTVRSTAPGANKAQGVEVCLLPTAERITDPAAQRSIVFTLRAATHTDGRFTIRYVPAMPWLLARTGRLGSSGARPVTIEPGQTTRIDLGQGRALSGRVDLASLPGRTLDPAWVFVRAFPLDRRNDVAAGIAPQRWQKLWASVDAGVPADEASLLGSAMADVQPDGRFTLEDLQPGRWLLLVQGRDVPPPNQCGFGAILGTARQTFTVQATGTTEPSADLGSIRLSPQPYPQVGQPAPLLSGRTMDGKAFSADQARGKVLVLDFWASWCAPCGAEAPLLGKLASQYAANPRVQFIGVDFDWDPPAAERAVQRWKLTWPQVAAGQLGDDNPVSQAWGVVALPSIWLIGPEGTVLAKDLHAEELPAVLERALGGP